MKVFRKKIGNSFGGCKIMTIFAASNHQCGLRTAGITSSLFYAHTYRNNGITTPCPEPGNRPGVSALMSLTARSVVSLCQNINAYVTEELFWLSPKSRLKTFLFLRKNSYLCTHET